MDQEQVASVNSLKEKLESELKIAELLINGIQGNKYTKTKENADKAQQLRIQIEKHTTDLIKQVYTQRDQIKEELKSVESDFKKKLIDQVLKEKQLTEKHVNEAKKYLSKKDAKKAEALNKLLDALDAQNEVLKKKINELNAPDKSEYKFLPNETLVIGSDFNGTIEEISKVNILSLNQIQAENLKHN